MRVDIFEDGGHGGNDETWVSHRLDKSGLIVESLRTRDQKLSHKLLNPSVKFCFKSKDAGSFLPHTQSTLCASRFTMYFFAGKYDHVDRYARNELWQGGSGIAKTTQGGFFFLRS